MHPRVRMTYAGTSTATSAIAKGDYVKVTT